MELPTPQDLRQRRKSLDLTQSSLAESAGVSQPLIARIEGGDVDPRLSTLRRIVEALDEAEGSVRRAESLMQTDVVTISPDSSVREAISLMIDAGYSQLPVVRDGRPQGLISNSDIRHSTDDDAADLPVAEVMQESITTVEPGATVDEIDAYLDHHDAVMVVERGELLGIVTEADLAAQFS
ncbi:CBS domain-containing protein [Salinirubrum litoreum]|uniref:CBS domain-containing protein n=1 Tax=Salinirubrum litoreum TaxID=1126234 RepID=A0ABD5RAK3_9EURY|nr:CBS domain-containing protein [Salinirubrum litoreum]